MFKIGRPKVKTGRPDFKTGMCEFKTWSPDCNIKIPSSRLEVPPSRQRGPMSRLVSSISRLGGPTSRPDPDFKTGKGGHHGRISESGGSSVSGIPCQFVHDEEPADETKPRAADPNPLNLPAACKPVGVGQLPFPDQCCRRHVVILNTSRDVRASEPLVVVVVTNEYALRKIHHKQPAYKYDPTIHNTSTPIVRLRRIARLEKCINGAHLELF
jgi:hypothetical protein